MSVSGTTTFTMAASDIVWAALRLIGAYSSQDTIPVSDTTNCMQALNIVAKKLALEGLPLWCVQTVTFPVVVGQAQYNLSTLSGTTLPLRVLDCYTVNINSNSQVRLTPMSRYDFDRLGNPTSSGSLNMYFYDPQLSGGILTVYDVPAEAIWNLKVNIQRQVYDFNLATDAPDFPQEFFQMLKWGLADEIALEYLTPPDMRREISQKFLLYKEEAFAANREEASIFFAPSKYKSS